MLVVLGTSFDDTSELTNDSVRLETVFVVVLMKLLIISNRIVSDVINIQASNELNGTLTIQLIIRKELKMDISVSIQSLKFCSVILYIFCCL